MRRAAILTLSTLLTAALLTTASLESATALDNSGLIAWWKLNEGFGAIVSDSSGSNYQGTIHGASWTNNQGGNLCFNGISDYVSLPSLDLTAADSLTIVASIYSDLTEVGFIFYHGDMGEFNLGNGDLGEDRQLLNINSTYASFSVKLSDGSWHYVQSSSPMQPNMWHKIVGVWVKGVSLRLYVDGVFAGEKDDIAALRLFNPGSSFPSSLGIYSQDQWHQQDFFKGQIRDVMVFNRALTSQEIDALPAVAAPVKPKLDVSCKSSASNSGFHVEIKGSLTLNETALSDELILLSYSVNGGKSWQDLTMTSTASDGTYSATWYPTVTGIYLIKAVYEGNANCSGTTTLVSLSVAQYGERNAFSVTSNSTVSSLIFNSTSKTLGFSVVGDSGTTGYAEVYIAKNLVSDASGFEVYLDGNKLEYKVASADDSWLLSFTYPHSEHYVSIYLGLNAGGPVALGESPWVWVLVVVVTVAVGSSMLVYFKKRKRKVSP